MSRTVTVEPLNKDDFESFGQVIESCPQRDPIPVNQGRGSKYPTVIDFHMNTGTQLSGSIYVLEPTALPFELTLLEKHPHSNQLFVPMGVEEYLVVVAMGDQTPLLESLRVFKAGGRQGINYNRGIWHAPLHCLHKQGSFFCQLGEHNQPIDTLEHKIDVITIKDCQSCI